MPISERSKLPTQVDPTDFSEKPLPNTPSGLPSSLKAKQSVLVFSNPSATDPTLKYVPVAPKVFVEYPVNLLSFDGGGVKGLFSLRALILALQGLMGDKDANENWIMDARNFVTKTTGKDSNKQGYETRWLIWAQQMDNLGVAPQDCSRYRWLDYAHHETLPMQLVEIDVFFEYYVSCVLALSGTSTGGLIVGGIAAGMTLTQLAALYMDPKTCGEIFRSSWNPLRWKGIIQAKYTQDGVNELIDNIFSCFAPCDAQGKPTVTKFLEFADTHNQRIHSLLQGSSFEDNENRMRLSLKSALEATCKAKDGESMDMEDKADAMLKEYQRVLWKASDEYLSIPRFYRYRNSADFGLNRLNSAYSKGDNETQIIPARFVITARCANNAGAVFFDSQEPCSNGENMNARNRTVVSSENVLVVNNVTMKDVLLSTSAAPYYFPPHKIGNLWFQDGGVVSNDPGLVSGSFLFRTFGTKGWGFLDESVYTPHHFTPALKLLRVGTGKSITLIDSFPWWKGQGIGLIAELAPMFMSSDSDRTDLLSDELSATSTLKSIKLNSVIPRQKHPTLELVKTVVLKVIRMRKDDSEEEADLPMDKVETVDAINSLFALINSDLFNSIAIPTNELLRSEEQLGSETQTSKRYAVDLVESLKKTRKFLKDSLHNEFIIS